MLERGADIKDGQEADSEERGDYCSLGEDGSEGDYHVLGEAGELEGLSYEVPVPQKISSKAAAGNQQETEEYSTLQHH